MDEKQLQALYNSVSEHFDIGSYDDFKSRMQTPEQRKSFYDVVGNKGFDLGDYNEYEQRLGGVKKKDTTPLLSEAISKSGSKATQSISEPLSSLGNQIIKGSNQFQNKIDANDPVKSFLNPFKQTQQEAIQRAAIPVSESTGQTFLSPANQYQANIQQQTEPTLGRANENLGNATAIAKKTLFPTGKNAKDYLTSKIIKNGSLDPNNETENLAVESKNEYDNLYKGISANGSIEKAAISDRINSDENFKQQVAALQKEGLDIPRAMQGQIIANYLYDNKDNLKDLVQEHPELQKDYEDLTKNFLTKYPETADAIVANKISQAREKLGYNSAVANFNTNTFKKHNDQIAGTLSPEEQKVWENDKDKITGMLDTGGMLNRFEEGIEGGWSATKGLFNRVTLQNTHGERLSDEMIKQATGVTNGETGWKKALGTATNFAGTISYMMAGGGIGQGAGLSPAAAEGVMNVATFADPLFRDAESKYPNNPFKATLSGMANMIAFASLSPLKTGQISDALSNIRPAINDVIKDLPENATVNEAKKTILGAVEKGLKQYGTSVTEMGLLLPAFNQGMDMALGLDQNTFDKYHHGEFENSLRNIAIGAALPAVIRMGGEAMGARNRATTPPTEEPTEQETTQTETQPEIKAPKEEPAPVSIGKKEIAEQKPSTGLSRGDEPSAEQQLKDIQDGNVVTFEYKSESEVPEVFKDKISSKGEINGKPYVKVTMAKSLADFHLQDQSLSPNIESPSTEVPKEQPQAISSENKTGLVLYHGSPHSFENFDITKLGSGEGAQAFGHGLYFTNEENIAKGYANKLGSRKNFWEALMNGQQLSLTKEDFDFINKELDALGYDGSRAESENLGDIKVDGKNEFAPQVLDAMAVLFGKNAKEELKGFDLSDKEIDKLLEIKKKISDPQLYKVAVHEGKSPSEYDYIDWREKLTDSQRKKIGIDLPENATGEDAYKALSQKLGNDKKASEYLLSKGIDGITYKSDKGTGGKTGEGRNYVIFDPKAIRVDEINQQKQAISSVEGEKTDETKTEVQQPTEVKEPIKGESDKNIQPTSEGKKEKPTQVTENQTPPPNKTEPIVEEGGEGGKNKALATRLVESKNIPSEAKKGIEEKGLKYEPQSHEEAATIAKEVLDQDGIDKAVLQAQAGKFGGDVNTLIQTEALNRLAELSDKEPEGAKKFEYDKKFAEIATGLDEWLRNQAGRGISALNYFYKKSPLGMVMVENQKRGEDFKQWSKPKEKSWKQYYDELMKEPEFEKIFKEEVRTELKKERAEARKARTKKVDEFFDKAKDQFKDKGAMYSTIIPPKIITAALEGMKQAYHAGEAVVKIVQDAIDYVSDKLGHSDWDKEKFRKEWEEKLKDKFTQSPLEKYKERLRGQIEALNEQINNKKRNVKAETKTELDKEAEDLTKQRDELKKQLEEIVPIKETEEYRKKFIERYRKKLRGLSEKDKDEVIRRSFKELIENGALEFDDFKKIIGQVTGRGELTPEQVSKMKELVKKLNSAEEAGKNVQEQRTKESLIKFHAAQLEAGKAHRELNAMFNNKPDIVKRLTSIMQLNTLGIPSLINNPIYNVFNQMFVRFPVGLTNDLLDRGMAAVAKLRGKPYDREWNILETQKEFWKGLGLGAKESAEQLLTGLNRQDYIQKEVYGQQIRPFRAMRDLIKNIQGKKPLSSTQKWDRALQATVGIPAEAIARVLNLGDKPQRFAAERAQASTFAKELGLKDIDKTIFMEFPREEAYRAYKAKGLSDVEAGKKADYIKDVIVKEGQRSTFQQDNLLNQVLTRAFGVFGGKESGTANLLKSLTVSPYIKIPSNAFWSFYNIVNPEVALLQSMIHGARAYKLRNAEGNASKLAFREARYWMGHAITGIAVRAVVTQLVNNGIFTPSQEDETKKEREGRAFFEPQGTVNVTKLNAWLRGQNPDKVKDGVTISSRWFGVLGMTGNSIAKKYEDMTPEQREKQQEFWNVALGGMEVAALSELQNGVFSNTSAIINALGSGSYGAQQYGLNVMNMVMNIGHPAALAQISRAQLPYYTTSKADNFKKQVENSILVRSSVIRSFLNKYPEPKLSIWGEPMMKPGNTVERLFGINHVNKDNFAQPIYEDVKETGDIGFFPPPVPPTLGKKKLNTEQSRRLTELVGQARKNLVAPYINDMAEIEGFGLKYSELKDKDLRKKVLSYLYDLGKEEGVKNFINEYPEFEKEGLNLTNEINKAKMEVFQEINKVKTLKQ